MNKYITFIKAIIKSRIGIIDFFREKRDLKNSNNFDPDYYTSAHVDFDELRVAPYLHYILFGKYEARPACENYTNNFSDLNSYRYKLKSSKSQAKKMQALFIKRPLISILMYIDTELSAEQLSASIQSIDSQWYNEIEISVGIKKDVDASVISVVENHTGLEIKICSNAKGLADAYQNATGSYIAVMRAGDLLAPDAIFEMVKQINANDAAFIYSDEDKINSSKSYSDPYFKSGFSYEMLLSYNFVGFFAVIKRTIIDKIGDAFDTSFGKAESYDLYLKVIEKTDQIFRIPKVLYHKRICDEVTEAKRTISQTIDPGYQRAVESHLKRTGQQADILPGPIIGSLSVRYKIPDEPLVSIIIPYKDKVEYLESCVKSILEKTEYKNYEIILVSNNSSEPETAEGVKKVMQWDKRIKSYTYDIPFNYSKINNYAVKNFSKGEYLLLLNNDTVVLSEGWVKDMLSFATKPEIAAVGPKLSYPNDTIQTAGVGLGIRDYIGEFHKFFSRSSDGYYGRLRIDHNVSAVSAACVMIAREKYLEVGGFDEVNFAVSLNDLDLCFRLVQKGYRNVLCPAVELYHYESLSRTRVLGEREMKEKQRLLEIYAEMIQKGDPYFNPNFEKRLENFSIQ